MSVRSHVAPETSQRRALRLGRSRLAELWFADRYDGILATPDEDANERWDVRLGDQRYDVKSVEPHHTFVDGGDTRPRFPAAVVLVDDANACRLLGVVPVKRWTKGVPHAGFAECWFVTRADVDSSTILPLPAGTPLGAPRRCPSCDLDHPVGTTCAGGWAPWQPGTLPWEDD